LLNSNLHGRAFGLVLLRYPKHGNVSE
jgi:hypothetical protein